MAVFAGLCVVDPRVGSPIAAADIASVACGPSTAIPPVPHPGSEASFESYQSQVPERIVDTRDGRGGVSGPVGAGCTLTVDVGSAVPGHAVGLALSLTVVSPEQGFFTAFPCAKGRPGTSSVNARPGRASANLVVVAPDVDNRICIFSSAGGHVIIDVSGWWEPGTDRFTPVDPVRAIDTRLPQGAAKRPPGDVTDIDVAGTVVPQDATAVVVNLAAVNPTTPGFLVVYPCGTEPPLASNLNFASGDRRAVAAIVKVGVSGKICVTGNAETHFIVDVTGFYAPSSATGPVIGLASIENERVVDTRSADLPGERFTADGVQRFDLSAALPNSDETVAVVLNFVATQPAAIGFLTVWPCTQPRPTTSSLNFNSGQTANLVVTSLSPDAEVCVYASTGVHVVIDLVGAFAGPPDSLVNQIAFTGDGGIVDTDQPFDVAGADYTLHCDDGVSAFDLRLGLAPGANATVDGIAVTSLDTPVIVPDEGLVTLELSRGLERATYHFRCVPQDFPRYEFTRSGNKPGWYMVELGWNSTQTGTFLAILDERGVPVWYKRTERKLLDFKRLSNGTLTASEISGRGFGISPTTGYRVFELDGSFVDVRRTSDPVALPADHHDYAEVPGAGPEPGRAMVSYPLVTNVDVSDLVTQDPFTGTLSDPRCTLGTAPTTRSIVDSVIDETAPNGSSWQWAVSDHFSIEEVTLPQCFQNYPTQPGGSEIDVFHVNSMQRVAESGCEPLCDYVVGARHLDAVFRVDRATGDVQWILSSRPSDPAAPGYVPNLSGAPRLEIVNDPRRGPLRMHDARLSGNLLTMHDNRTGTGQPSRIVTYRIDSVAETATLVRQIIHPSALTGNQLGSAQVMPDGGVVVGWGSTQPVYAEYDSNDKEVMRMELEIDDTAYRIVKYGTSVFDVAELRAAAGGSLETPI